MQADPDRLVVALFSNRLRWSTTVGLQAFLGLFFLTCPGWTMTLLEVPSSVEMGSLYQLYGVLLMHRAIMEQFVRWRGDPAWMRFYMISTYPFGVGSAILLGWASWTGLMNAIIGWVWVAMFVAEIGEYSVALYRWRTATRTSAA